MTLLSSFALRPLSRGPGVAPCHLDLSDLSMIIPVRNNQRGIHRLLVACLDIFAPQHCPKEILIVDSLSAPALIVPRLASWGLPVQVLTCSRPGAAAARNLGARTATGQWLLFLDSDCLPTAELIAGYPDAMCGAVAYAGVVRAEYRDPLPRYYETQGIFSPPPVWNQGKKRPAYLVTANTLVWRDALYAAGGFDERFPGAAGVIWRIICQEGKAQGRYS